MSVGERMEARRETWRLAVLRGFAKRMEKRSKLWSNTDHASLLQVALACVEFEDAQAGPVDVEAVTAGMLDRFFEAKSSYDRPRMLWLAENVSEYLDPTPSRPRRRSARQAPCDLTADDVDTPQNRAADEILGIATPPLQLAVGGDHA